MKERVKKINNICGAVLFVILLGMTITALINAITTPWMGALMNDSGSLYRYYINVYLTNMCWAIFVFGVIGLFISCLNFFTKNKFKYVETIYFSTFFIFMIVITCLLKPTTYYYVTTVKAEVISAFGTFMLEIFAIAFYLTSRILQFWVLKSNETAESAKDISKKKRLIGGIVSLTMAALSLVASLTLFILPNANVTSEIIIGRYNYVYLETTNNSDKKITNVYIMLEYYTDDESVIYSSNYYIEIEPNESSSLRLYDYNTDVYKIKSIRLYYEVDGMEGALPAALSLLPITTASICFAIYSILPIKKREETFETTEEKTKSKAGKRKES